MVPRDARGCTRSRKCNVERRCLQARAAKCTAGKQGAFGAQANAMGADVNNRKQFERDKDGDGGGDGKRRRARDA